jgi:phosphatidylinositol alpha-1,6-mannosyltransferase
LSAISLEPTGGGVAVVARLLWDVMSRTWGERARRLTLIDGAETQPSFGEKSRYALRLAALQTPAEPDWILFSHLGLAKPLLALPRAYRKPYSVFVHGIEAWRPLPAAQLQLLADAKQRIANSAYTATRLMACHPEIGPVDSCPLALPASVTSGPSAYAAPACKFGPHMVLVVGRMLASERYKGHDELIEAWPAVVSRVPDARLVIAGTGDGLPRLKEKAAASRANASILFTGFVSAGVLDRLYSQAALFALPSRAEGFGLVYLEAMSRGIACIGSRHDAAGDVVADGLTGRLVNLDHPEELAGTLAELLEDDDRRQSMGREGYRRYAETFTIEAFTARFLGLVDAMNEPMGRLQPKDVAV